MELNASNTDLRCIANCVCDVVSDHEYRTSQYEMYLDIMLSFKSTMIVESENSIIALRDAIGYLNSKLLTKYDTECELFDSANSLECFQPKYSICKAPCFCDYAELYVSILGMEYMLGQNGSLDAKYSGHTIKRDFVSVLGRFLFLYNGFIKTDFDEEETSYSDIFVQIFITTIRIVSSLNWTHEEYPQLRVLLLNLYDAMTKSDKSAVKELIDNALSETLEGQVTKSDDTIAVVYNALDRYYEFLSKGNNITEIKVSWLYAYIYKKRFGFMFCKKFAKSPNTSSLPYKFQAYSTAFKNGTFIQVSNGPKVVLFDAGENRRSSEYVPTQSTAFYNAASGMFE